VQRLFFAVEMLHCCQYEHDFGKESRSQGSGDQQRRFANSNDSGSSLVVVTRQQLATGDSAMVMDTEAGNSEAQSGSWCSQAHLLWRMAQLRWSSVHLMKPLERCREGARHLGFAVCPVVLA